MLKWIPVATVSLWLLGLIIAKAIDLINWWLIKQRRNHANQNLVANFSVELGTTEPLSWFYSLAGTEWVTSDAKDGAKSLRINVSSATADWRTAVYLVDGGTTYRCGLWIKGAGNVVTVLAVRWFSDALGTVYIGETWIVLSGNYTDWTKVEQSIPAPTAAQSGDLMFRAAFSTTVNVLGDAFFVQELPPIVESFELFNGVALQPWDIGNGTVLEARKQ